ncbi:MAG: cytidine deaminase [Bacteroidales bacterium]|nr:cytidine deaminase [Bacteroidales bacterium]
MIQHSFQVSYNEYSSVEELSDSDKLLAEKAREACKSAYAPYSRFHVGAALKLENGVVITGNNQENSAYPSGLCAERVAVFAASSQYPGVAIESIAIIASTEVFKLSQPITPCGSCRQVLAEYEHLAGKPIRTLLIGNNGSVWIIEGVNQLLPMMFEGAQLKKS